jgi:thioredoxin-dependent peroxiredoxin
MTRFTRTRRLAAMLIAGVCLTATAAQAALKVGDKAPPFEIAASLAGQPQQFSLTEALKSGPVVLYFYPAAFTSGCTIEANNFAEATDTFRSMGATVIGVSTDKLETLHKFSVSECRNRFAVGADPDRVVTKAYDAVLWLKPDLANRTSYVISPEGVILESYTALDPGGHVDRTLAAVRQWHAGHGGK